MLYINYGNLVVKRIEVIALSSCSLCVKLEVKIQINRTVLPLLFYYTVKPRLGSHAPKKGVLFQE